MKKITLLAASIFLLGSIVANADERNHRRSAVDYKNAEPIVFTERGIQFYVFADGQFDFDTHPSNDDRYYKSNRKQDYNKIYGKSRKGSKWNNGIEQDRSGKIRRIGNVQISYDSRNRVERIGSINLDYNRYALTQVGGLHIVYNRHYQIVDMFGSVNRGNDNQYVSYDYDDHNDCNNNTPRPKKVVANLDIRINR